MWFSGGIRVQEKLEKWFTRVPVLCIYYRYVKLKERAWNFRDGSTTCSKQMNSVYQQFALKQSFCCPGNHTNYLALCWVCSLNTFNLNDNAGIRHCGLKVILITVRVGIQLLYLIACGDQDTVHCTYTGTVQCFKREN